MKRVLSVALLSTALLMTACDKGEDNVIDPMIEDTGMLLNGVLWATRNVGEIAGTFVAHADDYGGYYNFLEAQTACPPGWRVPTAAECESLRPTLSGNGMTKNSDAVLKGVSGISYSSIENPLITIFFPNAGWRRSELEPVIYDGIQARYWTSSIFDTSTNTIENFDGRTANIWAFEFSASIGYVQGGGSGNVDYPVRCVSRNK